MRYPHRSFGVKTGAIYVDRPGAYLLAIENGKIAVVRTPLGLFLPGGGIDPGESHADAIHRECLEETGFAVETGEFVCSADAYTTHHGNEPYHPVQYYYRGRFLQWVQPPTEADHQLLWLDFAEARGKMFSEMQNWALEMCN